MPKPVKQQKRESLWHGPYNDGTNLSGVTQSMLGKFLICRERFRLSYVEGVREEQEFNPSSEYGNMWHVCEEYHRQNKDYRKPLKEYADKLCLVHSTHADKIIHWYHTCGTQWLCYLEHEKKQSMKKAVPRIPIYQEEVFDVQYKIYGTGPEVRLRGKFDSVDWHGKLTKTYRKGGLYIQENKSKGDIDIQGIQSTLDQDLQNMFYCAALLTHLQNKVFKHTNNQVLLAKDLAGVVYNVIRRPFSDWRGTGNIKRKVKESEKDFYNRLRDLIRKEPHHYFISWKQPISLSKIKRFNQRTLDPLLFQLCKWWDSIKDNPFNPWQTLVSTTKINTLMVVANPLHWQMPYGVFNGLADGRRGDFFELLTKGSDYNLEPRTLFSELLE